MGVKNYWFIYLTFIVQVPRRDDSGEESEGGEGDGDQAPQEAQPSKHRPVQVLLKRNVTKFTKFSSV